MIKPAQLYTEELKRLYCETWYDPKYIYYHSDIGTQELQFSDNNYERHSFAILENNEVVGYISYRLNWAAKVTYNFGIISFKQSLVFGKDLMKIIDDIFMKYKMNKMEFCAFSDNPVIKHYYSTWYQGSDSATSWMDRTGNVTDNGNNSYSMAFSYSDFTPGTKSPAIKVVDADGNVAIKTFTLVIE